MKIKPKSELNKVASTAHERAADAARSVGEAAAGAAGRAGEVAAGAASKVNEAASSGMQKVMESIYRPVFPEQYASGDYDRPKMVAIADGFERKDVEVCEGSIGWSSTAAGIDVLHLYEEAVPFSGITFFPQPLRDSVYYEDPLTPERLISLDCYFDALQKDRITELRRIAYELGARKCTLESIEEAKTVRMVKGGIQAKAKGKGKAGFNPSGGADVSREASSGSSKRVVFSQTFEGSAEPRCPELKWFAHDQEIEFLISTRCNCGEGNVTKNYRVELDRASTQTMSVRLAAKLDGALGKLGAACNFSLQGEALTESRRRLVFEVEF